MKTPPLRPIILRTLILAAGWAICSTSAPASLLLYEGFDYGGTDGSLNGKGTAGAGWGGSWATLPTTYTGTPTFSEAYQSAGLTFSTLGVSGGKAFLSANGDGFLNAGRVHTASITGTLYGSYLFRTASPSFTGLYSVFEGAGMGLASASAEFAIEPDGYNNSRGGVITGGAYTFASGTAISANETFLTLFKMTDLGGVSVSQTATMWLLKASQYDNFIGGGIDEAELDAAPLGTGATQVLQRASRTLTGSATFSNGGLMLMQSYFATNGQFDELRISNASLNEAVTAVPEPGTGLLLTAALAGILIRRRRSQA